MKTLYIKIKQKSSRTKRLLFKIKLIHRLQKKKMWNPNLYKLLIAVF